MSGQSQREVRVFVQGRTTQEAELRPERRALDSRLRFLIPSVTLAPGNRFAIYDMATSLLSFDCWGNHVPGKGRHWLQVTRRLSVRAGFGPGLFDPTAVLSPLGRIAFPSCPLRWGQKANQDLCQVGGRGAVFPECDSGLPGPGFGGSGGWSRRAGLWFVHV